MLTSLSHQAVTRCVVQVHEGPTCTVLGQSPFEAWMNVMKKNAGPRKTIVRCRLIVWHLQQVVPIIACCLIPANVPRNAAGKPLFGDRDTVSA